MILKGFLMNRVQTLGKSSGFSKAFKKIFGREFDLEFFFPFKELKFFFFVCLFESIRFLLFLD